MTTNNAAKKIFVNDAPTPFMNDENVMDAIEYDKHQITYAAYHIGAVPLRKSTLENVWNELCEYWKARAKDQFHMETRDEHIICASHGWTLDEVYLWIFESNNSARADA